MILPFLALMSIFGAKARGDRAKARGDRPADRDATLPGLRPKRKRRRRRRSSSSERREPKRRKPKRRKRKGKRPTKRQRTVDRSHAAARAILKRLGLVSSATASRLKRSPAPPSKRKAKRRRKAKMRQALAKLEPAQKTVIVDALKAKKRTRGTPDADRRRRKREARLKRLAKMERGAKALYNYVTVQETRPRRWGNKRKANEKVRTAQKVMRKLTKDGIYGPKTRTRGRKLIGKTFPARR